MHLYIFSLSNPARQMKYFAVSALDEGGFGKVWQGFTLYGAPIAIKVIKPTSDFNRDFSAWYVDQQVHLLCLNHPHVVVTFDQFVSVTESWSSLWRKERAVWRAWSQAD